MTKRSFNQINHGKLSHEPPKYLGRQAKVIWRRIVPFLEDNQDIIRADFGVVEMYCTQYEIYRNAYKHIQENGEVQPIYKSLQDSSGKVIGKTFMGYKRNPMTQIYDSAVNKLTTIGRELGLSPKARAELLEILPEKKDDKDITEQMKDFLS
ncbi:phage terminase small subunit P27 family [Lactobacillus sp. LC28-10]|uniref:Phage terminase small subunit P27 family n=1 Tax=Secundilactobacillus angelensis TaxID=2722706 RepID=A0ABX1KVN1_9LACO|nr:phage terminase small subunit P27 family [Secundilactobacillus angelensis]MCH5461513.1 phage terminase small subunit P27 family [Secundilactobacillus angelensis]NLR17674.1 phage terminase small subunit P27 family [Secundilactobacillus angelensis]